jgi:hypothetical protein
MAKKAKKMGRPRVAEGATRALTVTFGESTLKRVKQWAKRSKPPLSETEAIRQLVDMALKLPEH